MFSGIVAKTAKVVSQGEGELVLRVKPLELEPGESVAVNGCCLTLKKLDDPTLLKFDVTAETLERTNIGKMKKGNSVNIELATKANESLSGHILQGHIDAQGQLERMDVRGNSHILYFTLPRKLLKYIVEKGSVAVSGISLTVSAVDQRGFSVSIVPYTWEKTNLKYLALKDLVNIEVDILAKYLEKLIASKHA